MSEQLPNLLSQVRDLIGAYNNEEAERLLSEGLKEDSKNPELWAHLGLVYCYTQREVQAAELLEKAWGAEAEAKLTQILIDYFECRRRMARKLGVDDEIGARLLSHLRASTGKRAGDVGIKLSACLIVKNEEAHLDRCLASIKDLVDEIIVVDTGSTDRTVEIAEKHGAKVDYFEWCDDFSAARNEALKLASGDWALWIDADEEMTPRSFGPIREGLIRPHYAGYFVQIVNFLDEQGEANRYVHSPIRIFQLRPGVEFSGKVHEQISPSLSKLGLPNATLENVLLNHYGYRPSEMDSKDKIRRTLDLLERQVAEEPKDPFHWFNLANAHAVAEDYASSASAAAECIERLDPTNVFGSLTYQLLQTALIELGRPQEALERAEEAEKRGFADILTEFERAHALSRLGRYDEALSTIDRCFEMEWPSDLTGDYGIVTHKRQLLKGQILAQMGRLPEALELLDHVFTVDPHNAPAKFTKGAVLEKMGRLDEALALFEQVFASASQGRAAKKGAARIYLAIGQPSLAAQLAEEAWKAKADDIEAWQLWLDACESHNDFESAIAAYEDLFRVAEPTAPLLVNFGRLLQRAGDAQSALNCYMEAAKLAPQESNAYFNCGDLLYSTGHYAEAADVFETGLRLKPEFAQGWFVLGNCFAQLGIAQGAVVAYQEALRLEPDHTEAKHNLEIVQAEAAAAA